MDLQNTSFNNDSKEEVRSRIDIASVIGRYVKLKGTGSSVKGLCPFHKEKTPSFTVSSSRGAFKCFGCGKGGDVFTFLMEIENLSFPEALERLAEEAGVTLSRTVLSNNTDPTMKISRNNALKIHGHALQFYYKSMRESPEAIEYFKNRGLLAETVRDFRLGYAPKGWSGLTNYLTKLGVTTQEIVACGLALTSSDGKAPYDRFRDRIIFPIQDTAGKPIAFAGRGMEKDAKPKYLNSPETVLYKKNRVLYGIHLSRESIKTDGFVIFVEGYMDYITLFQAGICNVVATSGTALTPEHGDIIHRFSSKIILVFDGDSAGVTAAKRAIYSLASQGLDVRVVLLPENEDPDSFLKQYGVDALKTLIFESKEATIFALDQAHKKFDVTTPMGKSSIIHEILPLLINSKDRISQAERIKIVGESVSVSEKLIYDAVREASQNEPKTHNSNISEDRISKYLQTETGSFLHILIKNPNMVNKARTYITHETFTDTFSKNLYSVITTLYDSDPTMVSILSSTDDPIMKNVISTMLITKVTTENAEQDLNHKAKRFLQKENLRIRRETTCNIKKELDSGKKQQLLVKLNKLISQDGELSHK